MSTCAVNQFSMKVRLDKL